MLVDKGANYADKEFNFDFSLYNCMNLQENTFNSEERSGCNNIFAVVEIKNPYYFKDCPLSIVGSTEKKYVNLIRQVYKYMAVAKVKYGVFTNLNNTVVFQIKKPDDGRLFISNTFKKDNCFKVFLKLMCLSCDEAEEHKDSAVNHRQHLLEAAESTEDSSGGADESSSNTEEMTPKSQRSENTTRKLDFTSLSLQLLAFKNENFRGLLELMPRYSPQRKKNYVINNVLEFLN
jgi:hypothetical protein